MDLSNALEIIEDFEGINREGVRKILGQVNEFSGLNEMKYIEFRNYLAAMNKTKGEVEDNSSAEPHAIVKYLKGLCEYN